jgi:hypothetical protein
MVLDGVLMSFQRYEMPSALFSPHFKERWLRGQLAGESFLEGSPSAASIETVGIDA